MLIYSKQQTVKVEQYAMQSGISQQRLMENAGSSVAKAVRTHFSCDALKVVALCGRGNNGGDGFVAARRLHQDGALVTVILVDGTPSSGVSNHMMQYIVEMGVPVIDVGYELERAKQSVLGADVIIDAMYGFGFSGCFTENVSRLAQAVNSSAAFTVSVDVPSGVACDTGTCADNAIMADLTVTFISYKLCHLLYPSALNCGKVIVADIGAPVSSHIHPTYSIIDSSYVKSVLPARQIDGHKGTFGTVLTVCGSYGMCGAAEFSARAALKSGAGLVRMSVSDAVYRVLSSRIAEPVYDICTPMGVADLDSSCAQHILKSAVKASSLLIGCGCKNTNGLYDILETLISNVKCPMVIDADGINALSQNIDLLRKANCDIVLTPHYGEMARLCGVTVEQLVNNRIFYGSAIAANYGVSVVLKGAHTLVFLPDGSVRINLTGNNGMATAGSGDMLAGIIAALMAQGVSSVDAAAAGVYIHGSCGDVTEKRLTDRCMTVSDMLDDLHMAFSQLDNDGNG